MQAGNSEKAFEFSMENLELQPSDRMLSNASARGCSIREYAARIATLPMRINERNKEMAHSTYHPLEVLKKFKNKVADLMMDINELINSPLITQALGHYQQDNTFTIHVLKETIPMLKKYAEYCLENKNMAFLMSINKRTFYSVVYSLNGFRFSGSNYKEVGIHQFISSIKSSVVCGDYYSAYGDKNKDEQVAFDVMDDDVDEEVGGEVIKRDKPKNNSLMENKKRELDMFLSISAGDLFSDYEVEDGEEEMKEERMKRKREEEDDETKEIPMKSQRTSIDTIATEVEASSVFGEDCNADEFDFNA